MNLIIYRGPLERARLAFIFEALEEDYLDLELLWIYPGKLSVEKREFSMDFLKDYDFSEIHVLEHRLSDLFSTRRSIRKVVKDKKVNMLAMIGFSALDYGIFLKAKKRIWFVNGIPEENELNEKALLTRFITSVSWLSRRLLSRHLDLTIAVSNRMKQIITERTGIKKIFTAPTCVDTSIFNSDFSTKKDKLYCYLGSAAPWQALDLLSEVWQELYKADNEIKFRVISRDEQAKILGTGIPPENIEFVASGKFQTVAGWLNECTAGFLLRRDNIINKVSFPTKLAEYLASGCWVVSVDIDWDIRDYFQEEEIGVLVSPQEPATVMASKIIDFQKNIDRNKLQEGIKASTESLNRAFWKKKLKEELRRLDSNIVANKKKSNA